MGIDIIFFSLFIEGTHLSLLRDYSSKATTWCLECIFLIENMYKNHIF